MWVLDSYADRSCRLFMCIYLLEMHVRAFCFATQTCASHFAVVAMARGTSLNDLVFVGMVGICDPPRPFVREAIQTLVQSGVKVKLVTGDAQETAVAIGKSLMILQSTRMSPWVAFTKETGWAAAASGKTCYRKEWKRLPVIESSATFCIYITCPLKKWDSSLSSEVVGIRWGGGRIRILFDPLKESVTESFSDFQNL